MIIIAFKQFKGSSKTPVFIRKLIPYVWFRTPIIL